MLAVVSCHFNPCGFSRPKANLHRFREQLAGIPCHFIELSFDDSFELAPAHNVTRIKGGESNWLWQKERLINIAVDHLPDEITSVAWIDADIEFRNPDWYFETCRVLQKYPVCQLFEHGYWLDGVGKVTKNYTSVGSVGRFETVDGVHPHPGFAWAMRRSVFDKIGGLFDYDILGSGDSWMAHAFSGHSKVSRVGGACDTLYHKYNQWFFHTNLMIRGQIGCVPGGVFHHYHGTHENRQYQSRKDIYQDYEFDFDRDVKKDSRGLWKLKRSDSGQLQERIKSYFTGRREDAISSVTDHSTQKRISSYGSTCRSI